MLYNIAGSLGIKLFDTKNRLGTEMYSMVGVFKNSELTSSILLGSRSVLSLVLSTATGQETYLLEIYSHEPYYVQFYFILVIYRF